MTRAKIFRHLWTTKVIVLEGAILLQQTKMVEGYPGPLGNCRLGGYLLWHTTHPLPFKLDNIVVEINLANKKTINSHQ